MTLAFDRVDKAIAVPDTPRFAVAFADRTNYHNNVIPVCSARSRLTMSSDDLSNQMEGILELMTQRASGRVDNLQVETAVQKVLSSLGAAPGGATKHQSVVRDSKPSFKMDMGNYDDNEDDHGDEDPEDVSNSAASSSEVPTPLSPQLKYTPQEYRMLLEEIPMGKVGSQMMTTFGDGPQPDIDALKLALKGVREALQLMVMDARAVHRKAKVHFVHAQEQALSGVRRTKMLETQQAVDPSLVFRAMLNEESKSHDPLGKNKPCGFDVDQLKTLYPEEVRAYHRWNELHSEYNELSNKKGDQVDDDENSKAEGESSGRQEPEGDDEEEQEVNEEYLGGHLKERAATFDARTADMEKESYIKFSRIRQGSFLPRRQQRSPLEMEWEAIEIKRGRIKEGSWMRMSAVSVRFLHWLGFDPPEKPPPDADTTQVLGFLGYDRMGRIVEKAVYLRNARRNKDGENPTDLRLRKLPEGDQLTEDDIQEALQDPDVKPESLFRFEKHSQSLPNTQLYFGPGFEQRLELELEE